MYRLGIDIGGTKVNIGILDENKRLLGNKKLYVDEIEDLTCSVTTAVKNLCRDFSVKEDEILCCGIGVPGTVSEDGKRLVKAPNISILSENVAEKIEEALHIPAVLVQDSRAAAWGEYLCGCHENERSLVCITLGTGIGTGMVIDGKIYNGSLGCAGELGHIPVVENGRKCGCGKCGCLEKYCAGGGLDITAQELLGESKTAEDLFQAAKSGNEKASEAINQAVKLLGNAVVTLINILSPDCILFSGGLSGQKELYIDPLIAYVEEHCYTSGRIPRLERAVLGENAPLAGAALYPVIQKKNPRFSASIMCADTLHLGRALEEIKDAGIDYIHCDIMDNHFVPNLMLPMEMLNQLHEYTDIPFDYHVMAENPQSIIHKVLVKKGDIISVHYESTNYLQMLLNDIREMGAMAAVALNPSTPVTAITEVLPDMDMVLLMSVNPGFSGQKIVPGSFDKIRRMRKFLDENGCIEVPIEVDGNCSFENVPKMYAAGAELFVTGTSSIFSKDMSIKEAAEKLKRVLKGMKRI